MRRYVIDANLPYRFNLWQGPEFTHVFDLGDDLPDQEIWKYAKEHHAVIVTKDTDFSNQIMLTEAPPQVIHIKLGNLSMRQFYEAIHNVWDMAIDMLDDCKLITIYKDRIVGIRHSGEDGPIWRKL